MEWISVKDKLPEKYQQVLTYGDTSNGGFHIQQCEHSDGIFRFSESQREHKGYITHWMELPKLPTL